MSITLSSRPDVDRLAPAPVHVRSVHKSFGRRSDRVDVLTDISLEIEPGETVALLGPSGCGKSTLLRLIAGLDLPTAGEVHVDGHPVTDVDPRCSVVFQEPRLLPWRSIASNVRLGARDRQGAAEVDRWLDLVGLDGFGGHLPKQVSGGMAQRAALARALIGHPGVLLLDEPFAALDALTRLQMQDLLADVTSRIGATVLLVTHDVDEALYLADRIVVLGARGEGIVETVPVAFPRPRDRGAPELSPLRAHLLRHFGIHV
jgi:ABC-type nitrate/sulfonate/bicarbonate transport system ATPase subunit